MWIIPDIILNSFPPPQRLQAYVRSVTLRLDFSLFSDGCSSDYSLFCWRVVLKMPSPRVAHSREESQRRQVSKKTDKSKQAEKSARPRKSDKPEENDGALHHVDIEGATPHTPKKESASSESRNAEAREESKKEDSGNMTELECPKREEAGKSTGNGRSKKAESRLGHSQHRKKHGGENNNAREQEHSALPLRRRIDLRQLSEKNRRKGLRRRANGVDP